MDHTQLERINRIEDKSWKAWEKSKNPRHLDRVSWCVEQRLKMFDALLIDHNPDKWPGTMQNPTEEDEKKGE